MVSTKSLVGEIFNGIEILQKLGSNNLSKMVYKCKCHCGKLFNCVGSAVKSGNNKGCGCKIGNPSHRLIDHPLYQKYYDMKSRCENTNHKWYSYYGGKGITVEWTSFEEFFNWSISNGWKPGLSIDRINSKESYTESNCEYVTVAENSRRMRLAQFRRNEVFI